MSGENAEPLGAAGPDGGPDSRRWLRSPFLWAFVVGCVVVTLIRPLLRYEPAPPPVMGRVPDFALVDSDARPFGSADLRGSVYVASFFYSACQSICPAVMHAMGELQRRYAESGVDGVRIVSISVDPEHDRPERLREAAARYGADPKRWTFLTGRHDEIRDLCLQGFRVPFADAPAGETDIGHTGKVVLVDPTGAIRGWYSTDEPGIDEVFHRSQHVLREAKRS